MPSPLEANTPVQESTDEQERIDALICQITDGFLRGDEKRSDKDTRPFEELLTNLLPRAGIFARSVVSQKLGARADVPRRVLDMLLEDDAAAVEPFILHSPLLNESDVTKLINRRDPILRQSLFKRGNLTLMQRQSLLLDMPVRTREIRPATLQIAAQAAALPIFQEQPIHIDLTQKISEVEMQPVIQIAAEPVPATLPAEPQVPVEVATETKAVPQPKTATLLLQNLVRAAVLRRHDELAKLVAAETGLSTVIAQALLKDLSGEALMAVCHHIAVPEDAAVQIATLLYPVLLRTREQLTGLRQIYRNFTPQATARIVNAWRALPQNTQPVQETVHLGEAVPAAHAKQAHAGIERKMASNQ